MILYLVAGLVLLLLGAEGLIRGSVGLATRAGIPPLLLGLTLVALGTSSPEILVTVRAAYEGNAGLAVGNVVGSNIFNVLFVLGSAALFGALAVSLEVTRRDVPLLIAVSLLALGLAWNGRLGTGEGIVLLVLGVGYTLHLVKAALRMGKSARLDLGIPRKTPGLALEVVLVVFGIPALVFGAGWLVRGASGLAEGLGVPDHLIGLTIVAAGTSLPEVVTSVSAAIRGEGELAVGNVVGSNLYNIFLVLGAGAVLSPGGLPVAASIVTFDLPLMFGAAVALLPIAMTGHRIDRWEGGVFLAYWLGYCALLVMGGLGHPLGEPMEVLFLVFLLPLTLLTFGIVAWRAVRSRSGSGGTRNGR